MRTPIDTLREKYFKTGMLYETDFNEADAMHKEQIKDAWDIGLCVQDTNDVCAEYYYNKTFGRNNE